MALFEDCFPNGFAQLREYPAAFTARVLRLRKKLLRSSVPIPDGEVARLHVTEVKINYYGNRESLVFLGLKGNIPRNTVHRV